VAGILSYNGLTLVPVQGASGISGFHIGATTVTQAFWTDVMGTNPAQEDQPRHPATHVSWTDITARGGFLERLNALDVFPGLAFRLPSEAEWEYAARGGPHSSDGFVFSGSNDIDEVAWYCARFSAWRRLVVRLLGWKIGWRLVSRPPGKERTHVHDVALKNPNQLGLYDMTGNVWEWCQDEAFNGERRLRGGCYHNWDIHCTNGFRYAQPADARGGAVGFRLVLA
jgi:formylglycine-generating enzyme required for sulfatase activity